MIDSKTQILQLLKEVEFLKHKNESLERKLKLVLDISNELKIENKKIKEKNIKLEKENIALKLELEKFKVKPNEPSGSKPDYLKSNFFKSKKPGRKPGFKGKSRKNPRKIHKVVNYKPVKCKHCKSDDLIISKTRNKVITDIEFNIVNTKEILHDVTCKCCGKITKALSVNGDSKSPFGKGIQTLFAYLRSIGGMTIRPIENLFTNFFGIKVTDTTVSNNEIRLSKLGKTKYNSYLDIVKESQHSNKDETTYRVGGVTHWIWVYDNQNTVFYRLSKTRGKKTLIDDFGKKYNSISINDCYPAYNLFSKQQICFAHLLREAKFHAKKENKTKNEVVFYNKLKQIYYEAKVFVEKKPPDLERNKKYRFFQDELVKLMLSLKKRTDFLRRMFNRLNKYLESVFLFVKIKDLPSTNNLAERDLRSFVIHRKASFGSQSFNGAEAKVIFKTIFENNKRKGYLFSDALNFLFENYKEDLLLTEI